MQVQPYLFFNGRCEEALKFYGEKLGAQVLFQMRFSDAPPNPQQPIRPGTENKIMHSTIRIGSPLASSVIRVLLVVDPGATTRVPPE